MDIIVSAAYGQGGYGDFMFALKTAQALKQELIKQGKLEGDVYLVTDKRGKDKIHEIRGDCEFGVTILDSEEAKKLIADGHINPAVTIAGPTHLPNLHSILPKSSKVILSSEYSLGRANINGKSVTAFQSLSENEKGIYAQDKEKLETNLMAPFKKAGFNNVSFVRSGLIGEFSEQGVLLTQELLGVTSRNVNGVVSEKDVKGLTQKLSPLTSHVIFRNKAKSSQQSTTKEYFDKTNLVFAYTHKETDRFLRIHQEYITGSNKNQDLFFVTKYGSELEIQVNALKERLIAEGYSKIVIYDMANQEEKVLHDNGSNGKVYRVIHAKMLEHEEMIALLGLSDDLAHVTGDQSLGEAISANKIISYECLPHKLILLSAYQNLANALKLSEKCKEALKLMQNAKKDGDFTRLGQLLKDPQVKADMTQLNREVHNRLSLGMYYARAASPTMPAITQEIKLVIIQGNNDVFMQLMKKNNTTINKEECLMFAIKYNQPKIARYLIDNGANLAFTDPLGNSPFIAAAQAQNMNILSMLINKLPPGAIEPHLCKKNLADRDTFDYLTNASKNNSRIMIDVFGKLNRENIGDTLGNMVKDSTLLGPLSHRLLLKFKPTDGALEQGYHSILSSANTKEAPTIAKLGAIIAIKEAIEAQPPNTRNLNLYNAINKAFEKHGLNNLEKTALMIMRW
jgi:hypothetical protein